MTASATGIEIVEVGPRDGLQNEPGWVGVDQKTRLVDTLSECGFRRIEVGSFVKPERVPQMAGTAEVFGSINRRAGVSYMALAPNLRGLEDAIAAGADEIAVFASASDGFSVANLGRPVEASLEGFRTVVASALNAGVPCRGYISCVLECPYDGLTQPACVTKVAESLLEFGCYEISLGDTIGKGTPEQVGRLLEALLQRFEAYRFAGHFHDTAGNALANVSAAMDFGIRVFDASIAGLGGCPFAPGASGNVATEDLADMLVRCNENTGLDKDMLAKAAEFAKGLRTGASSRKPPVVPS